LIHILVHQTKCQSIGIGEKFVQKPLGSSSVHVLFDLNEILYRFGLDVELVVEGEVVPNVIFQAKTVQVGTRLAEFVFPATGRVQRRNSWTANVALRVLMVSFYF
jgi:hypothetical protein